MDKSTKAVRSRLTTAKQNGDPFAQPPVFAAPFHFKGDPSTSPFTYGRFHNPTWTALEEAIAGLESTEGIDAKSLVFPSGMAAAMAVLNTSLRSGSVVALPESGYYGVRKLLDRFFTPMGVVTRFISHQAEPDRVLRGIALLWLETPTNPELEVWDLHLWSDAAHRAGALVAVDNSTATPLGQNVLSHGADYSVVSGTKALTGHSDLVLGHVAVAHEGLWKQLLEWRTLTGTILGPMEAWLALRSIPSLPMRLERSSVNALAVAKFLAGRPDVLRVMYPGLPSHLGHALASAQMNYFGPVVSFVLKDREHAESFLARTTLVSDATSFGGITTTAERRERWAGDAVDPGLIRMSVGCEVIEDILTDIQRALES